MRGRARALTLTLTLTLHPNQARAEGNELFKAGNYPAAIEKYTDAMKRDPTSALPYRLGRGLGLGLALGLRVRVRVRVRVQC